MINLHNYKAFHFKAKDTSNLFKCVTNLLYHQFQPNNVLMAQIQTRHTSLLKSSTTQNQAHEKPSATIKTMLPTWL